MNSTAEITRTDPDLESDELSLLGQFLDYHRATLRLKCAGLSDEQLRQRAIPPSDVSLLGLVRHLSDVERSWFARRLDGQQAPPIFYDNESNPDGDFDDLDSTPVAEVWSTYDAAVAESGRVLATFQDGSDLARGTDEPRNVRWVLVHMIEEYARHNGHADLLRERIDGMTGE